MARTVTPLTDPKCEAARYNPAGKGNKLSDGGGLFLLLKPTGSKSWRMKYIRPSGKEDTLVIGDYPAVSLKMARQQREEAKAQLAQGIDPKEQKREEAIQAQQDRGNTFEAIARDWHNVTAAKWSPNFAERQLRLLETNLFPDLGKRPVITLKTRDLLAVVRKIEKRGAVDVASRMSQRITAIMRHAVQGGFIDSNPALDLAGAILPRKTTHRPALPLAQLSDLQARIDAYQGRELTRLAVRLTLLVFIRSSELRFARWEEIDLDRAMWTIPGERAPIEGVPHSHRGAKMKTTHLVPLSRQAVELLTQIHAISGRFDLVFPGDHHHWKPMSENTTNKALRGMGYDTKTEVCGHGFRTMACSALVESSLWQRDAVERQMSHQERNGVRAAYIHKAEHIQERRLMVQWWADYLDANRREHVTPYDFAHPEEIHANVVRLIQKA